MLSLIQAQSNSVIAPPISVQAQSNQANETQYVSSGNDSLADEDGFFNDNVIVLNLTNTDSESPATVNLFQLPIGEGDLPPSDVGGSIGRLGTTISITSAQLLDVTAITWNITIITPTPSATVVYTGALPSPANVGADALVTGLSANTDTTWAWKLDGSDYVFYMTNTSINKYNEIVDFNGGANPLFKITNVFGVSGSTVSIPTSEAVDYNAITQEVNNGCYKLPCVNVYANDISQANREFVSLLRKVNGFQTKKILNPTINPNQAQFVTENVQIQYTPLAGSLLKYTLNAGESVTLIFKYDKNPSCGNGNNSQNPTIGSFLPNAEILNEQMHQCDTKPLAEVTTKPLINTMTKPIDNPLISIIKPSKPTVVYTKPTVYVKPPVIDVAKPILPTKPLFKPVLNDTSIVYPKPPMVSPRPIFEKPMPKPKPKPQVVYDEPIQEKPTYKKPTPCPIISVINKPTIQPYIAPKPIVLVPVIIKPTIINVVDTCRTRRNPRRTNMREYISRFQPSCPMEEVFDYFENSDYKEL